MEPPAPPPVAPSRLGPGPEKGTALTPEAFRRQIDVSRETLARLERYDAMLRKWNRAINLVGSGSLCDPWRRHFLDSAQLLPLLPPAPAGRHRVLMDLGSGAGFPGLVLAILGAGRVHLCEADQKKAVFLREAARETGTEVSVRTSRIEDLAPFPVDAVTARACAPLARVLAYAAPFLDGAAEIGPEGGPGGGRDRPEAARVLLVLKGRGVLKARGIRDGDIRDGDIRDGDIDQELTDSAKLWNMRVERIASRSDPRATILRFTRRSQEDRGP